MKTIKTLTMTLLFVLQMTACNAGDKVITSNDLPAAAQTFISKYFGGKQMSLVKEAKKDGVPAELVPAEISSYVSQNYPGQRILQIDRTRTRYEVDLSNGLELKFNKRFKLVGIDN